MTDTESSPHASALVIHGHDNGEEPLKVKDGAHAERILSAMRGVFDGQARRLGWDPYASIDECLPVVLARLHASGDLAAPKAIRTEREVTIECLLDRDGPAVFRLSVGRYPAKEYGAPTVQEFAEFLGVESRSVLRAVRSALSHEISSRIAVNAVQLNEPPIVGAGASSHV